MKLPKFSHCLAYLGAFLFLLLFLDCMSRADTQGGFLFAGLCAVCAVGPIVWGWNEEGKP